ncbi:MAG: hypothetical protein C0469_00075 [Cyanobacteria bacterium DS2.3.42]|nr:hypothetical protein [Cyanobacteria bacterium DS2.3.42]
MRYVKLELLSARTRFEYNQVTYEKDDTFKGENVRCYPVLGGQVQRGLEEWLPLTAVVSVSFK